MKTGWVTPLVSRFKAFLEDLAGSRTTDVFDWLVFFVIFDR